jgi:flagellar biosynthesis/type III secretory pathway M-ring protein FliF/YscJ
MVSDVKVTATKPQTIEANAVKTKPRTLKQLEKLIERDPQAVAKLLRKWLEDENNR